jgi:hypothetical protein
MSGAAIMLAGCGRADFYHTTWTNVFWMDSVTVGLIRQEWNEHQRGSGSFGSIDYSDINKDFYRYSLIDSSMTHVARLQSNLSKLSSSDAAYYARGLIIYSCEFDGEYVATYNLLTKENTLLTNGFPRGVSKNGKYIIVYHNLSSYNIYEINTGAILAQVQKAKASINMFYVDDEQDVALISFPGASAYSTIIKKYSLLSNEYVDSCSWSLYRVLNLVNFGTYALCQGREGYALCNVDSLFKCVNDSVRIEPYNIQNIDIDLSTGNYVRTMSTVFQGNIYSNMPERIIAKPIIKEN